jgi:Tripartite tricarboxylate transporter TctB family
MLPKFASERLEPARQLLMRVRRPLEPEPLIFEPMRLLLKSARQVLEPALRTLEPVRQLLEPMLNIARRSLRADHVAGAAFVGFGLLILAFSGDLPFGRLSLPGAGFMPKILAWLMIVFGIVLGLRASRESAPLADIDWADLWHAVPVIAVTGVAILLYIWLGFILTMGLMMLGLLVLVERRNIFDAGVYSFVVVLLAFGLFHTFLRAPLPTGPLGF